MPRLECSGRNARVCPQGRPQVHESVLISNKDALLIAVPFGLLLLVQFFRLDEVVATARRPKRGVRSFCGPDAVGEMVLTDPDGRPVKSRNAAAPLPPAS